MTVPLYITHIIKQQLQVIIMSDQIEPHIQALYKPIKKIGSGAYGIVWKVTDRKTKQLKALKKNFDAFTNSTDAQRTYREIMFLKQLKHPNIIILDNIIRAQNDKDIYLVFEHMDVDLHTLIRQNSNNQHLQQRHKQYIIYQIAKAIFFLHNSDIIHRDLKPSNILVNESCEAKLCDFGLVRSLQEPQDSQTPIMTDYIATRWYRAPQLLLGCKDYSKQVDIWALGCLIGQMIRGKPMFPGNSTINQIQRILNWTGSPTPTQIKNLKININKGALDLLTSRKKSHKSDYFPQISSSCMDLLKKMLQFDPSRRINIQEVLKHEYLSQFYNKKQFQQILQNKVKLQLHINDNIKLPLKNYRSLIYSQIESSGSCNFNVLTQNNFGRNIKTSHSVHPNNHINKKDSNSYIQKKGSLQKDKTQKKLKTQQQNINFPGYSTSNNLKTASSTKKYTIFKDSKTLSNKKGMLDRQSESISKKKGISLCSKQINSRQVYNTSTSVYPTYQTETNEVNRQSVDSKKQRLRSTKLGHYKKVKPNYSYKNSMQKYQKSSSLSHYQNKNIKKAISTNTGYFVNDNIGRKESLGLGGR